MTTRIYQLANTDNAAALERLNDPSRLTPVYLDPSLGLIVTPDNFVGHVIEAYVSSTTLCPYVIVNHNSNPLALANTRRLGVALVVGASRRSYRAFEFWTTALDEAFVRLIQAEWEEA